MPKRMVQCGAPNRNVVRCVLLVGMAAGNPFVKPRDIGLSRLASSCKQMLRTDIL